MRKLGIIIAILAAVIIVAVLVVPALVNVNRYHGRIQAELENRLGRSVTLGPMRLSLLPLAIEVQNAAVGEDPRFDTGRPFARAEELDVSVKLWPLLRGDIQVQSLLLRQPQIELVRNPQGVWNFSRLGEAMVPAPRPQQPAGFSLAELKILDGQLAVTDLQKRQPRTVYDHIDLTVSGYAPGRPFDVSVQAHLPGAGAQLLAVQGNIGPVNQADPLKTPFEGKLQLQQVSLAGVKKFLNTSTLAGMDATASGEASLRNDQGRLDSRGTLTLENVRIRGVDVGYPISARYDFADDLNSDLLTIREGSLKLGSTPVSITGVVNSASTPAQLDLKVNASDVSIQEAARLAAALGVAFNPGMTIRGLMTADLRAQGAAGKPAFNGSLSARGLDIAGKDLPQPVRVNRVELALSPQAIRSNRFTASTGETQLDAQFALSRYTTPSPDIDLTLRTINARVGELLNIGHAYGVSALEGMSGSGNISLDLRATGPVKNSAAMTFSGNGQLQNASLRLPQLTKPLEVRNADIRLTRNSVVLEKVSASLGQTNATGTLTLRDFSAPHVQFTLAADKMSVSEWQQMFSSGTPQSAPRTSARWSLVPQAWAAAAGESLLAKSTGSGSLTIASVLYDQLLLNNVRSQVALDRGVVRLAPITAELCGGQQSGSIVIDTRPTPMVYTVSSKLTRVDANKLLSSVSSVKQSLYGLLAANANTTFRAAPADQIARTLNGTLSLDLRDGRIAHMDLLYQLASIGRFLSSGRQAQPFTNFAQMTGTFNITDGVARTDNLKAVIEGGALAANGAVNLVTESLDLRVTAVLSKALSQEVGGTGIGGFMTTVLANNRGELVIPLILTGTLTHPSFAPDLQRVAEMRLRNLVPTADNPGVLSSGILGAILGGKGQQQSPQGSLQGILGTLSGKQQQQQQQQQQPIGQPQPAPRPQQQKNPLTDILNSIFGQSSQQKQQQQQQQQQQQKQEQPQKPPDQPR